MKHFFLYTFLIFIISPLFSQISAPQTYRVYYTGHIDETPAFLEMLISEHSVSGVLGFKQDTMFSVSGIITPAASNAPASALLRISDDDGLMSGQLRFNMEKNLLRGSLVYGGRNANALFQILAVYVKDTRVLKNFLSYSVQYPYFINPLYASLNEELQKEIQKANFELIDNFADLDKLPLTMGGNLRHDRIDTIEIQFAGKKLISLLNSSYLYTGGPHGDYRYQSYNYSIQGERFARLELSNILSLNSERLQLLNRLLLDKLKAKKASFVLDGSVNAFEMGELSPSFSIKENGFIFTFAPYTVDAYSAGTYEIFISFDEIQLALSEEFKSLL